MKKMMIAAALILSLTLCGCGAGPDSESQPSDTSAAETTAQTVTTSAEVLPEAAASDEIDLTTTNSTMTYAIVSDMVTNPEDYVGKTVKASGTFYAIQGDEVDTIYYYVGIADALACCQQGLEFIWDDGGHAFPDEYPELESQIKVTGVYGKYDELGQTYYYIDVSTLEALPA